jgi:Asp-tRNA(Asn)/Glu-tRNA(Gln) amidotransferase A subunit family amidase
MADSFLDMPGAALPSRVDEAGLPTGVLLSCAREGDAMLRGAARQLVDASIRTVRCQHR